MILHFYFARKFLSTFLLISLVVVVILGLIDLVDELQDFPDLPFLAVVEVVALNLPHANYEILPLVLILSTVALYLRLARSSELVVVRAAGRSALRALMAPVTVALLIGIVTVTVLNPLVAASSKRYEDLVNSYEGGGSNILAIATEGIWLRQGSASGQTVIHAQRASSDLSTLFGATFISFAPNDGRPLTRLSADTARLDPGYWYLEGVKVWDISPGGNAEATSRVQETMILPSDLTQDRIIDSFGKPEFIPIWDLPAFIDALEDAGFSARRYAIWFQMELSRPLFLVSAIIFTFDSVPQPYSDYLWYNPIIHVIGMMRDGFYPFYHPDYVSAAYVVGVGLTCGLSGLFLLHRYHRDLLDK